MVIVCRIHCGKDELLKIIKINRLVGLLEFLVTIYQPFIFRVFIYNISKSFPVCDINYRSNIVNTKSTILNRTLSKSINDLSPKLHW